MLNTEAIWRDTNQQLLGFIRRRVREEQIAKDILQEVFLRIQLNLPHLKNRQRLGAWLYQITRNAIADHYRRRSGSGTAEVPDMPVEEETGANRTAELAGCIPSFIEALPEKYREALYLTELGEYTQKELAEQLQISYSGAKSRVQRGREKLKELLLACCEMQADSYGNIVDYRSKEKCGKRC